MTVKLSESEKRRVEEITRDLIRLQSDSAPNYEDDVGEYIYGFYKKLGIKAEKQICRNKRNNIIARISGKDSSHCTMYIGHMDTVPIEDAEFWTYEPLEAVTENKKMYGRGSCDMKGSIACAMYVTEYMKKHEICPACDLLFVYDVDEENTNLGLKEYLKNPNIADFIVVGEPTDMKLAIGHRGVMAFDIAVHGKSCHAGKTELGKNAIYGAAEVMQSVRKLHNKISKKNQEFTGNPSIQVTQISGGSKVNVIPNKAALQIDRRMIFGENRESCEIEMREILRAAAAKSGCRFELEITTYCPPGKTDIRNRQIRRISELLQQHGISGEPEAFEASCEAGRLEEVLGVPTIIWGPGAIAQAHQIDEYIELEQLYKGAELFISFFTMEDYHV